MQTVGMVAGEASGDILGSELIKSLRNLQPGISISGIAGPEMAAAGCRVLHSSESLSVMGLAEVISHLPELLRIRSDIKRHFLDSRPDVFVGIDAPDFNLGLERALKSAHIKTVHYVSPSVWAWRAGRIARIGQSADRVLALFPFEPELYRAQGVDAVFVGHPLADVIPLEIDSAALRVKLGLPSGRMLAVLPGSRMSEVSRLAPVFLATLRWLKQRDASLQFVMPMASARIRQHVELLCPDRNELELVLLDGQSRDAIGAADAVLLASGTAALEAMLLRRPMVVAYKVHWLTYLLVRMFKLLKVEHVSLPNVLAGEAIVPEILQNDVETVRLGAAVSELFENDSLVSRQLAIFSSLHQQLRRNASDRAAEAIVDLAGG